MGKFDTKNDFKPLTNLKLLGGKGIQFDEPIIALDNVEGILYVTTETKMYRLKRNGSNFIPTRIW